MVVTEEQYVINQNVLQNFPDTRIGGTLFDFEDPKFAAQTSEGFYFIIGFSHHGDVKTTTATFTAPPKRKRSFLQSIIDDIDRLELRSDYHFRPSKHAIRLAKLYIIFTYVRMRNKFPRPSFVLDGERGIVIKWEREGHSVRLNCFGDPNDDNYIYFENNEFDVEDNVTPEVLYNRLNWLLQYERKPAR